MNLFVMEARRNIVQLRNYFAGWWMMKRTVGAGKIIGKIGYNWECYDRRATFNEGRLKLHRYLSIMANKKLRKKYFKF